MTFNWVKWINSSYLEMNFKREESLSVTNMLKKTPSELGLRENLMDIASSSGTSLQGQRDTGFQMPHTNCNQ